MIGAALSLLALGIIFLFLIPVVGIGIGSVGLVLTIICLLGFIRNRN